MEDEPSKLENSCSKLWLELKALNIKKRRMGSICGG